MISRDFDRILTGFEPDFTRILTGFHGVGKPFSAGPIYPVPILVLLDVK